MNKLDFDESFLEILKEKIPQKPVLANTIADILMIEKESVYRRLRGDVHFTLNEVVRIAHKLGISLDAMTGRDTFGKKSSMSLELSSNRSLFFPDYDMIKEFAEILRKLSEQPDIECGMALNSFPIILLTEYKSIYDLYVTKWKHLYDNDLPGYGRPVDESYADAIFEMQSQVTYWNKRIPYTYYVLDSSIIANLVKDVKYFHSIGVLSDQKVAEIKGEVLIFLRDLESQAEEGRFSDTGNKFELYISDISFGTNYTYLWSKDMCLSTFITFVVLSARSFNKDSCKEVKDWVEALKKVSTLISEVGERERVLFFNKQREIVNAL